MTFFSNSSQTLVDVFSLLKWCRCRHMIVMHITPGHVLDMTGSYVQLPLVKYNDLLRCLFEMDDSVYVFFSKGPHPYQVIRYSSCTENVRGVHYQNRALYQNIL